MTSVRNLQRPPAAKKGLGGRADVAHEPHRPPRARPGRVRVPGKCSCSGGGHPVFLGVDHRPDEGLSGKGHPSPGWRSGPMKELATAIGRFGAKGTGPIRARV